MRFAAVHERVNSRQRSIAGKLAAPEFQRIAENAPR
jgi:hypothetical protein